MMMLKIQMQMLALVFAYNIPSNVNGLDTKTAITYKMGPAHYYNTVSLHELENYDVPTM